MNQNETHTRDSMVFYRSFYEALLNLPVKKRDAAIKAIFEYAFNNVEPGDLDPLGNMVFSVAKPLIDHANQRYISCVNNGKKGGRPRKQAVCDPMENDENKNPLVFQNENQEVIDEENQKLFNQKNLNENDYDNVNENDNENDNDNDNVNLTDNDNISENVYVNESTKKEPGKAGSKTHTYGEYENVYLTVIEKARLLSELGLDGYENSVEYLSRYLKRKPDYRSACHFEDLRGWVQDAVRKEEKAKQEAQKDEERKKSDPFGDISFEDIFER